jgi:hypothetical protein
MIGARLRWAEIRSVTGSATRLAAHLTFLLK